MNSIRSISSIATLGRSYWSFWVSPYELAHSDPLGAKPTPAHQGRFTLSLLKSPDHVISRRGSHIYSTTGPQSNDYPREPVKWDRLHPRVRPGPPIGKPASSTKPNHPSPQSQSLSRSYGSNLPTSLTYIILSTRGYSPRRPAADMGTS